MSVKRMPMPRRTSSRLRAKREAVRPKVGLLSLPTETLVQIAEQLDVETTVHFSRTSRRLAHFCRQKRVIVASLNRLFCSWYTGRNPSKKDLALFANHSKARLSLRPYRRGDDTGSRAEILPTRLFRNTQHTRRWLGTSVQASFSKRHVPASREKDSPSLESPL